MKNCKQNLSQYEQILLKKIYRFRSISGFKFKFEFRLRLRVRIKVWFKIRFRIRISTS